MPNWALFAIAGGVRLSIIELRWTRQLRAVLAPRSVHTGGKSEAQLTKKQAVLLMHDIYMSCHRDGGDSQGGTRHSLPSVRRRGGF